MNAPLSDWPRQYFVELGGRPFLFYVVYGAFSNIPRMSASQYRSAGVPSGFDLSHYDDRRQPNVVSDFRSGHLWYELHGSNNSFACRIAAAQECMILRGEIEDCETLNYFRDCVGLLTFLLDCGGIAIYDPFMFKWWDPGEWRENAFEPATAVPRHHVVVLTSQDEGGLTWFHTRGMRKFGRPDLSIHRVPAEHSDAVIDLFERFIEFQAFGGRIEEGQQIRMKSLPVGMTCHYGGNLDDPDFNNIHVEIKHGIHG